MKILHILDHSVPVQDGYSYRTLAILREQQARGWETAQITSLKQGPSPRDIERVEGLAFHRTRLQRAPTRMPLLNHLEVVYSLARRLDDVIRRERPDILHAHSPALVGLATVRAARKHRLSVVYECRAFWEDAAVSNGTTTEDGLRYRVTRALETRVFHQADAVICICEGLREDILSRGIDSAKVTVVPNAVDLASFPNRPEGRTEVRAAYGLTDEPVLGFIGSFYHWEGLDIAIRALPLIVGQVPHARLMLVGGGYEEGRLKALCSDLGVDDRVIFTGRVPNAEVNRYYDAIDVLVYPRRSTRLTERVTPLKPLEAYAMGKPLMASDVGGHRELIRHEETGILFPPENLDDLARVAVAVLRHPDGWSSMIHAGRGLVRTQRTWEVSVARYQQVYEQLVAHVFN